MPADYRIIISPRAIGDLQSIHQYIAQDSPLNASAMIQRLLAAIDSLQEFPLRNEVYRGRRRPREPVRRMPVPPFLVYYRVNETTQTVEVITIRHGKRRQPGCFAR